MRLIGNNGIAFKLRVAGYQFPADRVSEWDSDWLQVEGRVSYPKGDWSFLSPCLLTSEASRLVDWLAAVAAGGQPSSIEFIEPTLSFGVVTSGSEHVLRVSFELEGCPPWSPRGQAAYIEFSVAELDIVGAVRDWRNQLRQFPQRDGL
jgi:hypothetical protein